uniref:Tektin n=1 Tax=Falco tinnunculus TaxID=100819 RepID=A0A8C4UZA7_FALTI
IELVGSPLTAMYTHQRSSPTRFLPAISTMASRCKNCFPYNPLPQSFSLLWMSHTYYQAAAINPALAPFSKSSQGLAPSKALLLISDRAALFTRYTPDDWYSSNLTNNKELETSWHSAEHLRVETSRMIQNKYQQTKKTQAKSTRNLGECLDEMTGESNTLTDMKNRQERALAEMEAPLQVTWECLHHWEKRMGINLVHDNMEKQLFTVGLATHIMCYLNLPRRILQPCSLTDSLVLVRC